jgi:hypothetical protein
MTVSSPVRWPGLALRPRTSVRAAAAQLAGDLWAGAGTDLADLLTPFAARLTALIPAPLQRLRFVVDKRVPASQENTPDGARANIAAHYDLSNELFAAFLDPTMSYSGAWFDDGILDLAGVRDGSRVLEIGSDGARWPSGPRSGARGSRRSPCRGSSWRWPASGSRPTSRPWTGCSRRAGGSPSRPSPWPTTATSPPGGASAGCRSASSPAG